MAIKYLVINHEQTADVKTIIAYDTPVIPLGSSFLNFELADGDPDTADVSVAHTPVSGTNNFTHQVQVNFAWGGQTPVGADFALGTLTSSWVRLMKTDYPANTGDVVVNVVSTSPGYGTGYVTLLFAENEGSARSTNLTFRDISLLTHPNQIDGALSAGQPHNILDISQNGQQIDPVKSERRLKYNIELVGESAMGIPMYHFNYKDEANGKGRFIGTMVDDLERLGFHEALTHTEDGILVDYSKIDVPFHTITK